jgi:hypothetical protein
MPIPVLAAFLFVALFFIGDGVAQTRIHVESPMLAIRTTELSGKKLLETSAYLNRSTGDPSARACNGPNVEQVSLAENGSWITLILNFPKKEYAFYKAWLYADSGVKGRNITNAALIAELVESVAKVLLVLHEAAAPTQKLEFQVEFVPVGCRFSRVLAVEWEDARRQIRFPMGVHAFSREPGVPGLGGELLGFTFVRLIAHEATHVFQYLSGQFSSEATAGDGCWDMPRCGSIADFTKREFDATFLEMAVANAVFEHEISESEVRQRWYRDMRSAAGDAGEEEVLSYLRSNADLLEKMVYREQQRILGPKFLAPQSDEAAAALLSLAAMYIRNPMRPNNRLVPDSHAKDVGEKALSILRQRTSCIRFQVFIYNSERSTFRNWWRRFTGQPSCGG